MELAFNNPEIEESESHVARTCFHDMFLNARTMALFAFNLWSMLFTREDLIGLQRQETIVQNRVWDFLEF